MNFVTKSLAVLSAVFLLTACDSLSGSGAGQSGSGSTAGGTDAYGRQVGELAQGVADRVFFELDRSDLTSDAQATLTKQAEWLKQYPKTNITVEGHCDERGTREYNLALGERRASATKRYLVGLGVAANRISTISYGKERPAVIGSDENSWGQNRRAVSVITNQ